MFFKCRLRGLHPSTTYRRGVEPCSWDQRVLSGAAVVAALYYLPTLLVFAGTP